MSLKSAWPWCVALLIGLTALGFGVGLVQLPPPNAKVFIDLRRNTYISPPCLRAGRFVDAASATALDLAPSTIAQVRLRQADRTVGAEGRLSPDAICANRGGGFAANSALLPRLLGMARPRWTKDGDWNW